MCWGEGGLKNGEGAIPNPNVKSRTVRDTDWPTPHNTRRDLVHEDIPRGAVVQLPTVIQLLHDCTVAVLHAAHALRAHCRLVVAAIFIESVLPLLGTFQCCVTRILQGKQEREGRAAVQRTAESAGRSGTFIRASFSVEVKKQPFLRILVPEFSQIQAFVGIFKV